MKRISLHSMLKKYLIIATTIPILMFGLYMYMSAKNTYIENQELSHKQAYELIGQRIDLFNQTNEKVLDLFIEDPIVLKTFEKRYTDKDEEKITIQSLINRFDTIYGNNSSMAVGLNDGRMFSSNISKLPDDYDPRTRPWYKDAVKERGNYVLSDPYPDAINPEKFSITYSKAIIAKNGKIIGVAGLDVGLSELVRLDNSIHLPEGSFVSIFDSENKLISEPYKLDNFDKKQYIIHEWIHEANNWRIVIYTPKYLFNITQNQILIPTFFTVIILLGLSIIYAKYIDRKLMAPLDETIEQVRNINTENSCEENTFIYETQVDTIETENLKWAINGLLSRIYSQRFKLVENKQELDRQYMEIEALYEETAAMNETLNDMFESLNESYKQTIKVLSNAIEANDEYTRGHCDRVTYYALNIAKKLGFSQIENEQLEFSSILHDIGKISVPHHILNKEEKLTEEEWNIINKHPSVGYDIIQEVSFLKDAALVVRHHHEKFDGSGYPDGLSEKSIPVMSRIVSIADAYDAMTSVRAYRKKPLTKTQAIEELVKNAGTQFDSQIVELFVKLIIEDEI